MLVVKITGGMGNQMFQYAFGRSLSLKYNKLVFFDTLDFNIMSITKYFRPGAKRKFELNVFNKKGVFLGLVGSILIRVLLKLNFFKIIDEKNLLASDLLTLNCDKNFYFNDYWQSEKYFKEFEFLIKEDFKFKCALLEKNKIVEKEISSTNSVSIHVRRGDYVTIGINIGDKNNDYYKKAVNIIKKKVKNPRFFIFSDDNKWVKENLNKLFGKNVVYVDSDNKNRDFADMYLMSICRHNIIANSTFSWWGAWLNKNNKKIVIMPKNWVFGSGLNLFVKDWIKL